MVKQSEQIEECKKMHIIDDLVALGVFKVNDKQLYQVSLEELVKEYQKHHQ
ncbi:Fur-regulated basic protein FbpA [Viridibacillus sp. YIM B01967]|uniref:Fur-regulated basic protein FbpA n=1 Tax=Viridibacillus soli TaxID=2798301 RepID=A0ABS1H8M3_9BACL|nr:Fur-regulated basic protein FbpA [Viridibacillus soli]MBK3495767.1 Fur-regulated basic protein FbpA [Viridibacillus soli]